MFDDKLADGGDERLLRQRLGGLLQKETTNQLRTQMGWKKIQKKENSSGIATLLYKTEVNLGLFQFYFDF